MWQQAGIRIDFRYAHRRAHALLSSSLHAARLQRRAILRPRLPFCSRWTLGQHGERWTRISSIFLRFIVSHIATRTALIDGDRLSLSRVRSIVRGHTHAYVALTYRSALRIKGFPTFFQIYLFNDKNEYNLFCE